MNIKLIKTGFLCLSTLLLFGFLIFIPQTIFASGNGYSFSRSVTIDHTKVPNTTQANFPIEVCFNGSSPCNISAPGLNQSGGGAHVSNASGNDIIFTTDVGCTAKLKWEIEKYVPSTGELVAWVTNTGTALSNTVDTTVYMCYGNSSISTFQGGTAGSAWNSNYFGVYHLNQTTGAMLDSTSNGKNSTSLTLTARGVAGEIGDAANATGSTDVINLPITAPALDISSGFTAEGWINNAAWGSGFQSILVYIHTNFGRYAGLSVNNSKVSFFGNEAGNLSSPNGNTSLTGTALHHVVVTQTGPSGTPANTVTLYVDGNPDGTTTS
jgi:hypothetical protein